MCMNTLTDAAEHMIKLCPTLSTVYPIRGAKMMIYHISVIEIVRNHSLSPCINNTKSSINIDHSSFTLAYLLYIYITIHTVLYE